MASIERTCYPRLKKSFTNAELLKFYQPTEDEIYFTENHANSSDPRLQLLVLLKTFQRLGYFPRIEDVPEEIIRFLRLVLQLKQSFKELPKFNKSLRDKE